MTDSHNEGTYESRSKVFESPRETVSYWKNALELAEMDDWRKQAKEVVKIYDGDKKVAFNILYANTEITRAALYNSVPVPDIRVRYGDRNEVARKGGSILERAILYGLDEYDFDDVLRNVALSVALISRGTARVKYVPIMRTVEEEDEAGAVVKREIVAWQMATCEFVRWDKFRHGPGVTWSDVPWVAFETAMSRDELLAIPGLEDADAKRVPLDMFDGEMSDDKAKSEKSVFRHAKVWQIWDKDTRQVFLVCPGFADKPLAIIPDPLGLLDFFPCPKPVYFLRKEGDLTPVCPYDQYEHQARELNRVTLRMHALVAMLKVRGVRASEVPEIAQVMSAADGEFIPSQGALAAMGGANGLSGAIWMMPIREIITVIRELSQQREQIKQTIYEIAGISDIMRGAVSPDEKLGQSQMKGQYGSMRLSGAQSDLQRFVAEIFRIKAQIIANKFSADTLGVIAGENINPQVLDFLRNDVLRSYKVDIETDSTVRGDMVRAQQNLMTFIDGTSRYAQQIVPAVQAGIVPKDLALTVFSTFARQFKLGKELDDKLSLYIEQAEKQSQAPAQGNPEAQKAKQVNEASTQLTLQGKALDNQKKTLENQGQQIENIVQATTGGSDTSGFVN